MASLMVLKAPDMPSVLFETGYISNAADAAFLNSTNGRHRIAEAMSRAINVYFAKQLASRCRNSHPSRRNRSGGAGVRAPEERRKLGRASWRDMVVQYDAPADVPVA